MNVFVTFSNAPYFKQRDLNARCARIYGKFDKIVVYDIDKDMDDEFRNKHLDILSVKKGAGLWLWKVYFVNKAFKEECSEGDVLFYLDAAAFFYRSARSLINNMFEDIFVAQVPYLEESFTKREVLMSLNIDTEEVRKSRQFQASFMAFRKSAGSKKFLDEWLCLASNYEMIGPEYDRNIQYESFFEHRYDQSILSALCKKNNITPSDDPTFQGWQGYPYMDGLPYKGIRRKKNNPVCIFLHRNMGNYMLIKILINGLNHLFPYIKNKIKGKMPKAE